MEFGDGLGKIARRFGEETQRGIKNSIIQQDDRVNRSIQKISNNNQRFNGEIKNGNVHIRLNCVWKPTWLIWYGWLIWLWLIPSTCPYDKNYSYR